MVNKILKTCLNGHKFYKSSDCLSCPICALAEKPETGFLSKLGAPARRALIANDITSLTDLTQYSEAEILSLHGVGPSTLPILIEVLTENKLSFKK